MTNESVTNIASKTNQKNSFKHKLKSDTIKKNNFITDHLTINRRIIREHTQLTTKHIKTKTQTQTSDYILFLNMRLSKKQNMEKKDTKKMMLTHSFI